MDTQTLLLIAGALLPIVVTVALGFFSGWRRDFGWEHAATLNKTIMLYALPLSLFSNMIITPRATILNMGPVAIALFLALTLSFLLPLLLAKVVFKRDLAISTLQALAIGSPAVPFIGTSVLGYLFGPLSASLITLSSLTQNIVQIPLVFILLAIATGRGGEHRSPAQRILNALAQPVVWAPVLAVVMVLCGVTIPSLLNDSLGLLGKATSGLALFAAGIVLFARRITLTLPTLVTVVARNLVVPGLCLLALLAVGLSAEQIRQVVLTMAIPTGSIVIIIAMQFRVGEQEMASSMALSVIASFISMGAFIWLTHQE